MSDTSGGMRCPVDGASLVMSERAGIEIDNCPTCRGVWLDRGELDKIAERSARDAEDAPRQATRPERGRGDHRQGAPAHGDYEPGGHAQGGYGHGQPRRRKSFLQDLFD
jgi:uncharacterized protein